MTTMSMAHTHPEKYDTAKMSEEYFTSEEDYEASFAEFRRWIDASITSRLHHF